MMATADMPHIFTCYSTQINESASYTLLIDKLRLLGANNLCPCLHALKHTEALLWIIC